MDDDGPARRVRKRHLPDIHVDAFVGAFSGLDLAADGRMPFARQLPGRRSFRRFLRLGGCLRAFEFEAGRSLGRRSGLLR